MAEKVGRVIKKFYMSTASGLISSVLNSGIGGRYRVSNGQMI